MVGVSGIRGVIGSGLNPDTITKFSSAFGSFMNKGKVIVGRDARPTGEIVKQAVISSLLATGCDVIDLDLAPTPTIQLAVKNCNANGGIAITASHNPIEWNALKLLGENGLFLDPDQGEQVLQLVKSGKFDYQNWDSIGNLTKYDSAIDDHIDAILELPFIHADEIKQRKFKVVIDAVNSVGGIILPKLLKKFGCEITALNCEPTGIFAHDPEPLPENIKELAKTVKKTGADIGIAVDPDGDRLAFVSEKGDTLGEEYTLVLAVDFILSKKKGPVVTNLSTTRALDDLANKYGVTVQRTKVGEIHVVKKMQEINAVIGGEGNGGVILPDVHLGRDAPVGVALILQYLTEFDDRLSDLYQTLPQYVMTKGKIDLENSDINKILSTIRENHSSEICDMTDGLKIIREDSWIHLRASNTEPIIRIYTEARDVEESKKLCHIFINEIRSIGNGKC